MRLTTVPIYARRLLEPESPGRSPTVFTASLVGHASVAHRTDTEKRAGLAGWSAVASRYGEGFSSSGKHGMGALTLARGPRPLPGKSFVHGRWLREGCLAPPPLEPSLFTPHKALHLTNSCFWV